VVRPKPSGGGKGLTKKERRRELFWQHDACSQVAKYNGREGKKKFTFAIVGGKAPNNRTLSFSYKLQRTVSQMGGGGADFPGRIVRNKKKATYSFTIEQE